MSLSSLKKMRLSSCLLSEFFDVTLRSLENVWTTTSRNFELWARGSWKSVTVFVRGELGLLRTQAIGGVLKNLLADRPAPQLIDPAPLP